jgi:hypothetical protein
MASHEQQPQSVAHEEEQAIDGRLGGASAKNERASDHRDHTDHGSKNAEELRARRLFKLRKKTTSDWNSTGWKREESTHLEGDGENGCKHSCHRLTDASLRCARLGQAKVEQDGLQEVTEKAGRQQHQREAPVARQHALYVPLGIEEEGGSQQAHGANKPLPRREPNCAQAEQKKTQTTQPAQGRTWMNVVKHASAQHV